ncbi:unnamed protein product [Rotaria socialis]|uniref:IF rod domain-containing protein n=1 Tax=Rotaria socialis TaxID=392032 RepID=A0A818SKX2_9BILA|nr:unnamed protein product [Rotaria socialis]
MDNRYTSSTSYQKQNRTGNDANIFDRLRKSSQNISIVTDRFNSRGTSFEPSGKSAVVMAIQEKRQREKRELTHLNDRFASYIERVRFLEAQNKKYQLEIDHLRKKWGSETSKVKEVYEKEITEGRHILNDATKDCATIELRAKHAEEETHKLQDRCRSLLTGRESDQKKIELIQKQLFDNEADLDLFRRRITDLEDEQKRYYIESEKLTSDICRITKDLDHEIITRVQLENQKQNLEKEIEFLKEIHLHEIEEMKQLNFVDTTLDPTRFFKHELANAVKNIRKDYEQLNDQQRNELELWYQIKVTQAVQEIKNAQALEKPKRILEQEEIKRLRTLVADSRQDITTISQRNRELENRIRQLEELILQERDQHIRTKDERNQKISVLRTRLEDLERNYDELVTTKSSLDAEITIYRKLLEGEENREGLQQIISNVGEQNQANVSASSGESTSFLRSHPTTHDSQETQVQSSANREISPGSGKYHVITESTSIEHFSQNKAKRIQAIIHEELVRFRRQSLNRNNFCTPSQNLSSNRKESTIFEQVYGGRRQRPTTICLNVPWIPATHATNVYECSGIDLTNRKFKRKTFFETRAMWEKYPPKALTPPSSDYTDAYLAAFAPKLIRAKNIHRLTSPIFAHVKPISLEQITTCSLSSDVSIRTSRTRSNNNNTSNIPNKYEPFPSTQPFSAATIMQPCLSKMSTTSQYDFSYEQIYKPLPTYSSSPSAKPIYKPSVSFQYAPLSFPNNVYPNQTNKPTIVSPSKTEGHRSKPETLVFQHDEDISSLSIEKPSPIITPLSESSNLNIEPQTDHEDISTASSKPIQILEKTLNKYDTLINQISDILASVSPLSSTVSSMSPNQSILDYELTADGSPIIRQKRLERQSATNTNTPPRTKAKYLIRDDSYDKIIIAIADLDSELNPPSDTEMSTQFDEEDNCETIKSSTLPNENYEQSETLLSDGRQRSFITKRIENEYLSSSTCSLFKVEKEEEKLTDMQSINETRSNNDEFIQLEADLSSNILNDEDLCDETSESYDEAILSETNAENVIEDNSVENNENDENLSYQSLTEEITRSTASTITSGNEQIISSTSPMTEEEQMSTSDSEDILFNEPYSTELQTAVIEQQQLESSTLPETSTTEFSDSTNKQCSSSELIESQSSDQQRITSPSGAQGVVSIDITNENKISDEEEWVFISNIIDQEDIDQQIKEIESNKMKISTQLIDNISSATMASMSLSSSSSSTVMSSIDVLSNSISTCYISSDVYQGEKNQIIESPLDENIETVPCAVSHVQETGATLPSNPQNETNDVSNSKTKSNEYDIQIEESDKTELLTLHDTATLTLQAKLSTEPGEEQEILSAVHAEQSKLNSVEDTTYFTIQKPSSSSSSCMKNLDDHSIDEPESVKSFLQNTDQSILNTEYSIVQSTENQENVLLESSSLEIPTLLSAEDKTTESSLPNADIQNDQQILTTSVVQSETPEPTNSEQTTYQIQPWDVVVEKIDHAISSSLTEGNSPIIKQEFISINDRDFDEEIMPVEAPRNQSSKENEHIVTTKISDAYSEHQNDLDMGLATSLPQNVPTLDISKDDVIISNIIHQLIDDTIHTVVSTLQQNTIQNIDEVPLAGNNRIVSISSQIANVTPQVPSEIECDSMTSIRTKIEKLSTKRSDDFCESSSTNTEPNSFELIHALRNHSIALSGVASPILHPSERSSSSAASSHVTSSDRYVSYVIHQMGDSSAERLPAIPIADDIPIYKNLNEYVVYEPIVVTNLSMTKEDDSTEFDATENLTLYTDDLFTQKLHELDASKDIDLDLSSTDDDVDEEFDRNDLTNIDHMNDKLTEQNTDSNVDEDAYPSYDRATTPSSNNSSSSSRRQLDDVYIIPGYPGLWRPSANTCSSTSPKEYDADDECRESGNRNALRSSSSAKRPSSYQQRQDQATTITRTDMLPSHVPSVRPDTIDLLTRSLSELPVNASESDSYHTCPSSISKSQKHNELHEIKSFEEQRQTSPDERIILIRERERERGVSLPVTMKIDCDDIALRLSTSTPTDTNLYSINPYELASPSTHSEPPLPDISDSSGRQSSSSLINYEHDRQKLPPWLNTVKTVTTVKQDSDGPLESRITFLKSAKGPIIIAHCNPQGNYIVIENTSQSKNIDLTNWTIRQENDKGENLLFKFPDNFHLKSNQSLKILTKINQSEQINDDLVASTVSLWHIGPNIVTILYNSEGKDRSTLIKKTIFS